MRSPAADSTATASPPSAIGSRRSRPKTAPPQAEGSPAVGGSARVCLVAGEGVRLEACMLSSFTRSAYDQSTGTFPDTPSSANRLLQQVWGQDTVDTLRGVLTHSLQGL